MPDSSARGSFWAIIHLVLMFAVSLYKSAVTTYWHWIFPAIHQTRLIDKNFRYPTHLFVILNCSRSRPLVWINSVEDWVQRRPKFHEISDVLKICDQVGISYISLYLDSDERDELEAWIATLGSRVSKPCLVTSPMFRITETLHVRIARPFDGHQALDSIIDPEASEGSISSQLDWVPDPELIICTTQNLSLRGCPPWSIKWTEISHVPCRRLVSREALQFSWQRYNHVRQNFGS